LVKALIVYPPFGDPAGAPSSALIAVDPCFQAAS
jgi:hypothetical protein